MLLFRREKQTSKNVADTTFNQQSSYGIRTFFILELDQQSCQTVKNFFFWKNKINFQEGFMLGAGKCTNDFFWESIDKYSKGAKSCGSRSNHSRYHKSFHIAQIIQLLTNHSSFNFVHIIQLSANNQQPSQSIGNLFILHLISRHPKI